MLKKLLLLWVFLCFSQLSAQEIKSLYQSKKVIVSKDTIPLEHVSISPSFFKIVKSDGSLIDSTFYSVNFKTGKLLFKNGFTSQDTLTVRYFNYPDQVTKTYSIYDQDQVVPNEAGNLYKVNRTVKKFVPFDGLNTSGSITRGVSIGNNQNASVTSNLDLQITGKISDKVSLRASIQDSNIPLQEGGYSQKLDEFDQIFIELFTEKWNIRAGDLFLENRQSRFLNFNKKVQGLSAHFTFGGEENNTEVFAAGALVRGQYARSSITGQEGNQGPYKLKGNNGELYVLVISGSEKVYVNGILRKRGENNDYVIDYNAGEITFTSLFPITSEMRIVIEYQYSDRSYTRFVTYAGANHQAKSWSLGGYLYSENDVKNQPLEQNLSSEQVAILANAGDNVSLMNAPSAYLDAYSENKVLYKKVSINGVEAFEYSNNSNDVLYNVKFTLVGNLQGNYILTNSSTVGKIFQYIQPLGGVPQGNYEPITRLVAPTKIQIATVLGKFNPTEKTNVDFEVGVSNNDLNLFSAIDDQDNKGVAGKLNYKQRLFSKKWQVDVFGNFQYVQQDFRTIERLFNIEFNRDWNLTTKEGNQSLVVNGLDFVLPAKGKLTYQFEKLDFSKSFSGHRQVVTGLFALNHWSLQEEGSYLKSDGDYAASTFIRNHSQARYHQKNNWIGGSLRFENNKEQVVSTNQLSALSQRFTEYGALVGRGDSTKVYAEIGYLQRVNDSLQNGFLKKVNQSQSYYLKSKLVQTDKSDLSLFVNYRNLKYVDNVRPSEPSLNSRMLYNDQYFSQLMQVTTAYETTSGTIAQQEFTYLEVQPGQGVYTWVDYNSNGIQELQEFEVAPFPDQAKYVRVFLPNQLFVKTHQNKFSQSLILNLAKWQNEQGFRKVLSHFYNQTSYLVERKVQRNGANFDLNPFAGSETDLLGLNTSFRNSLFYNRGKQKHSITYMYTQNRVKSLLSIGSQESKNYSHQLQYAHLVQKTWLFSLESKTVFTALSSENYSSKNYEVNAYQINPKISYLFNRNASWDVFYEYQNKENRLIGAEQLLQHRFGTSFSFASEKKLTMNGEFSLYQNKFTGDAQSPVAFQMLEGLQPGKNMTWRLLIQKNLTEFLDININYQGRKTETSQTIHTGNVQLRAYF
ncbi:MAG: hypothetical protein RL427_618 [Bacteroidota bacterium]